MFDRRVKQLRRVTALLDVGVITVVFLASHELSGMFGEDSARTLLPHVTLLTLIAPVWVFLLGLFGAYRSPRIASKGDLSRAVIRATSTGFLLLATLLFVVRFLDVSAFLVMTFGALNPPALIGVRWAISAYFWRSLRNGESARRVLIIGSGSRAKRLEEALRHQATLGVHIVGYLDPDPERVGVSLSGAHVLGTVDEITSVLKDHIIDEVIVAVPRGMLPSVEKVVRACEEEGIKVSLMADLFEVNVARMTLDGFTKIPLLAFEPVAQEEWKLFVKRCVDLALTFLMMPIVLPVMVLIALAIKLDSPGPVFFTQERVGLNKRRFRLLKFRTMVDGSERLQDQLESLNEAQGPIFKIANDPRVTQVGRFLRRTSLDELPQLFEVITGEMSLVGPRPMSLRDVNLFDRGIQRKRFSVQPGLTCLWQVSGRSNLPFEKWLELDLWYIEHWSLALDLRILLKTIPVVIRGTGAI